MAVTQTLVITYIWMARYFRSYEPTSLLFSNGMQTLGVASSRSLQLWFVLKVISVSGDGGFLFSAQELEMSSIEVLQLFILSGTVSPLHYGGIPGRNEVRSFIRVDWSS